MRLIYHLKSIIVVAPFEDESRVEEPSLGYFSTPQSAIDWIRQEGPNHVDDETRLLTYHLVEYKIDVGPDSFWKLSGISPEGRVLGSTTVGDEDTPWEGREASTCRWKVGNVLAMAAYGEYRVGVVTALPPSPELAKDRGWKLDALDDVYLVKFADGDHEHPREWDLFEPLNFVPASLFASLRNVLNGV